MPPLENPLPPFDFPLSSTTASAHDLAAGEMRRALEHGDRVAALDAYAAYARSCAQEDREPRPDVTALCRQALHADAGPVIVPATPFYGRDDELREIVEALDSGVSAVILHGPGGVGKTRLAIAVSDSGRSSYDAVRWCALGDIESGATDAIEAAVDGLSPGARALIVVDEAERHAAEVVATRRALRAVAPAWKFLITTRFAEAATDVALVRVLPFATTLDDRTRSAPAVDFLRQRARAAGVLLAGDRATSQVLQELATRVDGLALALEIVAAQLRTFGPAEALARIDTSGIGGAFAERVVIATVGALGESERRGFFRFGIFPGRWTFADAEDALADDAELRDALPQIVERLVSWSLLVVEPVRSVMTYRYLSTTLDVARAHIAPQERERRFDRVAARVLARAIAYGERAGGGEALAFDALEATLPTLRAALMRAEDTELVARTLVATASFWTRSGHGRVALAAARRADDVRNPDLAIRLDLLVSACARDLSDTQRAEAALDRALPLAEAHAATPLLAQIWRSRGAIAFARGDRTASQDALERAVALERHGTLQWGRTLANLGVLFASGGHIDEALRVYDLIESACDDEHLAFTSAVGRATCFAQNGDAEGALAWIDRAYSLLGANPAPGDAALLGHGETLASTLIGDASRALSAARRALAIATVHDLSLFVDLVLALVPIAVASACEPVAVARLYGYAEAEERRRKAVAEPAIRRAHERATAALLRRLGEDAFARARRAGTAMLERDAVDLVFALVAVPVNEKPDNGRRDRIRVSSGTVERDGRVVQLGPRERDLVNALVCADRAVSRERLLEALWPNERPSDGANALRVTLHRLRTKLGGTTSIERVGDAFRLDPRADVDLVRVERQLRRRDRLDLNVLSEFVDDVRRSCELPVDERPWSYDISARLERAAQGAALRLAESAIIAGDPVRALDYASWLVSRDPLDEESVIVIVRAWQAAADDGAARRARDDYAERLRAELGAEPSSAVDALFG